MGVTVHDLMTAPVMTVEADDPLSEVAWAMEEKGIKSLAVVDEACLPVGILTSTDFVHMAADEAVPAEATVGDYMTTGVATATPDTPVEAVTSRLLEEGFNHVPVVDGEVVGILSTTDILQHVSSRVDAADSA
ncbi:MAG: CBS domain-containing protein [Natronomonas sp.]|jgi:CBS domain-containing protein